MPDVQRLREEELELLKTLPQDGLIFKHLHPILESLSACRALLEEAQQYIKDEISGMPLDDEQVKELEQRGKDIYTAIAAQLAGTRGGSQ